MNIFQKLLLAPIRFYKRFVSPCTAPACRFTPTCSTYAVEAIQTHGALKGGILAFWRILRCSPLGGQGYDPVPPKGQFRLPHFRQGKPGHF